MRFLAIGALLLIGAGYPALAAAQAVSIYAAASLAEVLREVSGRFAQRGGSPLRLVLGSSSSLARQIEQGAPADIFLSANVEWMDHLDSLNLIERETRVDLLGNALVVIAPIGEGFAVEARQGFDFAASFKGRLALGDPAHVPAGIYARQAFQWLGWWEALQGRLVPAPDVRAALAYVERGECAAGVVYATDAARNPEVEVLATLPAQAHAPIVYPMAVVKGRCAGNVDQALAFLRSAAAAQVFRQCGFVVLAVPPQEKKFP